MPFTLNTSASFALSTSTSSGDNWGRAYQTRTTINKDGTTHTKRTQRLGEPIVEETKRWDGKGRRVLEDGSVYEKNGKGKGWVQVRAPAVKDVQGAEGEGGSTRRRKGTILGMTCEPSKNVVGDGNGLGSNFGKGGVGKGTENWLDGIMGKVANDVLENRGKGRILQVVESEEEDSEGEYTDSEEYTSGEYTSDEEEEEEEKPIAKKSATTTQPKGKAGTQKQQKPKREMERKQKPTKAKVVQESSSEEDDEDDDGYEIEEVFSSDVGASEKSEEEEDDEDEEDDEQEQEKLQPKTSLEQKPVEKKHAEKQNKVPKGKNSKRSVAIP
ncbi:hypothetical protein SBOR_2321 [Sclerotinia borealis F-4128]|uniref:Uncharacterized protein n=1 Tax=Sclerotinia borealis (strain F-4128) TaxID=1432307 RepID=W9CMR2_SCLBF|nr:hypothetical protein SBOR_2321 [Sclerotinia borealis F-4128]